MSDNNGQWGKNPNGGGSWGEQNPWGVEPPGTVVQGPHDPIQVCWLTYKSQLMISTLPPVFKQAVLEDSLIRQLMCVFGTVDNQIGGVY